MHLVRKKLVKSHPDMQNNAAGDSNKEPIDCNTKDCINRINHKFGAFTHQRAISYTGI